MSASANRTSTLWAALCGVALLLVGCGRPAPSAPAGATELAATPYTADEIRAASPAGRRLDYRVETAGKPFVVTVMSFTRADDAGADVETSTLDETGHEIGTKTVATARWEELRRHAEFPRSAVVISEETITVPAGTFACRVYTVTKGDGVAVFWFAKELAGPPVKMETRKGGVVVETRTLVRHMAR